MYYKDEGHDLDVCRSLRHSCTAEGWLRTQHLLLQHTRWKKPLENFVWGPGRNISFGATQLEDDLKQVAALPTMALDY